VQVAPASFRVLAELLNIATLQAVWRCLPLRAVSAYGPLLCGCAPVRALSAACDSSLCCPCLPTTA
jgi:hypothetical protein